MTKKIFSILLLTVFVFSCSLFTKDSYQGAWTLTFSGDLSEVFDFIIEEDFSFSFAKSIYAQGRDIDAQFSGKISEDGTLNCDVKVMGMKVGEVKGSINYENGSGIWGGGNLAGKWTAIKKKN